MKLAISSFAWAPDRAAEMAVWSGEQPLVHGVELVLPMSFADPFSATVQEISTQRRLWRDNGLEVLSVQSLAFGRPGLQLFGPAAARRDLLHHLTRMAELASALGASRMVFGSPANRRRGELPLEQAMDQATAFFGELALRIRHTGVCCCIEPNPPIYSGCDMVVRTAEAVELVRHVNDPSIRVQIDTGSIAYDRQHGEGPSRTLLKDAIELAGHMHVSIPGLKPVRVDDRDQEIIAKMGAPWPGIEVCSIEMRSPEGVDPRSALSEAIAAVSSWYELEPRS